MRIRCDGVLRRNLWLLLVVVLVPVFHAGAGNLTDIDTQAVLNEKSVRSLVDARCSEDNTSSGKVVSCFLAFPDSLPTYFYETKPEKKQIVIKLLNAKVDGMVIDGKIDSTSAAGPVTAILAMQEIQNKNETVRSLTEEWFPVVTITLSLNPMILAEKDITVSDMESAIVVSLPWPDGQAEREKFYMIEKKPRSKVLWYSLIGAGGVGLAAGSYALYRHIRYGGDDGPEPLHPVLPEHPSLAP